MTVTEKTNQRLEHVNRILRAVRNINQIINHAADREELLQETCDCLTETGGCSSAWIAFFDEDWKLIVTYESGLGEKFRSVIERFEVGNLTCCAQKIRDGEHVVSVEEPSEACGDCPLTSFCSGRSTIVASVMNVDNIHLVLSVSVPIAYIVDSEGLDLLAGLAGSLGYALSNLDQKNLLLETEEKYRAMFDNAPISYQSLNEDGCFIDVNPAWLRTLGYARDEVIGHAFSSFLHPDFIPHFKTNFPKFKKRGYVNGVQFQIRHKDGSYRSIEFNGCIGYRPDGSFRQTYCVFQDITERIENEVRFQMLFENINTCVAIYKPVANNSDFEFVDMNPVALKYSQISKEEVVGKNVTEVFPGVKESGVFGALQRVAETGEAEDLPVTKYEDERYEQWVENHVYRLPSGLIAAVYEDISERQMMQEKLAQSKKMEAIGHLAGGVAHEFNNLLMGMMNYIDLCRDELGDGSQAQEWLDQINENAERSAKLTRQLLAFACKQTIAPKRLDLNEALEGMLGMLRGLIGEDIELLWKPGANLRAVKMDMAQIDQIMVGLCVNACDAIQGGGKIAIETANVSIDAKYCRKHSEAREGDFVMLAVSDDGCGMDSETLDEIFEPFFTTKPMAEATGLGLASIYGIVQQNKGFVSVQSEVGHGTTFRICLPPCD